MTVTSILAVGISGLNANSNAMSGVADNIANINTVGYKRANTAFSSLVADQSSSLVADQIDDGARTGGVTTTTRSLVSKQGLIQAGMSQTDLAIDGAGFFVARSGPLSTDPIAYTRAGSFTPDSDGYLRNTSGMYLQGWRLNSSGSLAVAPTIGTVQPIKLNELAGTAAPTSKISISANLDSRATAGATFTNSFSYIDSQGGSRQINMVFTKLATANSWNCDLVDGATTLATGTVAFNSNGTLASVTGTINTTTTAISVASPTAATPTAGTNPLTLDFGTIGQSNGMRQIADTTALINARADGGLLRTITSVDVSNTGQLNILFEDGTSRPFYQLPLATFRNPDGLATISGNAYLQSPNSGTASISAPGSLGAGVIKASSLEASNVDLAEEFSNMIRFQRAYSASSRIITTADEMLQEANSLKR
jgi:flagellar hook protein FlgE